MVNLHAGNRRRYLRFNPSALEIEDLSQKSMAACVHVDTKGTEEFHPSQLGVLVDQSHAGCSAVFVRTAKDSHEELASGAEVSIKAGALHPMRATVRWRKDLDEDLIKIGFEFLE